MAYKELATRKPFIVNKNLGSAVEVEPDELTTTNADGASVTVPTQKQKYDFDRNGWLLIPSLLSDDDIAEMREFLSTSARGTRGYPRTRTVCTRRDPLQKLADHPVVVGLLNEFLAYPPAASEDCYGFRLEEATLSFGDTIPEAQTRSIRQKGNGPVSFTRRPLISTGVYPDAVGAG